MRGECRARVLRLEAEMGVTPGLAVLMVGEHAASEVYVRNKIRACVEVGITSTVHRFSHRADTLEIANTIRYLNDDPSVHGILVQLSLPPALDADAVLRLISPYKDVDGFHLYN